jgi:hypothetical protein
MRPSISSAVSAVSALESGSPAWRRRQRYSSRNFHVTRKLCCAAVMLRKLRNLHNFPDQPQLQAARAHGEVGCRIGLVNRLSLASRGVATAFAGVVIAIFAMPPIAKDSD